MSRSLLSVFSLILLSFLPARAAEPADAAKTASVEELAKQVRPSVVVITVSGRNGKREGLGTGFVVSADGLIATNRHVIGEGRPLRVETADGKQYKVTAIHASDRKLDLAILRIDAKGLTPLPLGDSTALKDGQAVVAMGNPQGLRHSVVSGVVSGQREIDGRSMIQLAIPIEPGNSGGPLLDMRGRVHGILTIKSLVTENLGFAVAINTLKPLLKKPNPVPMSAWLTIGALDRDDWQVELGGQWRQRAGRIIAEGMGAGFGGRTLCLSRRDLPPLPCEIAVRVRLRDEGGAAGLIFHADGDKHYGFYPSNGRLRLTRFDGPDVFSWKVLEEKASPHYHPGEWNTLKVRLGKDRIRCFVNDHLTIESTDDVYVKGRVGLAKFRDTIAEFKRFQMAKALPPLAPPAAAVTRIGKTLDSLPAKDKPGADAIQRLAPEGPIGMKLLRERAGQLETQAAGLRRLAAAVHQRNVLDELVRVLHVAEKNIDLLHAALLIARLDNEDVDVEAYRHEVERMADKIAARLPKNAADKIRLTALNKYLFAERGFHGSRGDYYNRSNSYLSEVIDDREGLPITLSVLYIELARRLGVRLEGVGLPGHFVVRLAAAGGEGQLLDVYEGGQPLSREEAAKKVLEITRRALREEHLAGVKKRAIIVRILHNLLNVAREEKDTDGMLRYVNAIVAVDPETAPERGLRAGLRYKTGDRAGALQDVDWLLKHQPEGLDVEKVQQFRRLLAQPAPE